MEKGFYYLPGDRESERARRDVRSLVKQTGMDIKFYRLDDKNTKLELPEELLRYLPLLVTEEGSYIGLSKIEFFVDSNTPNSSVKVAIRNYKKYESKIKLY